jgi:hypothetical protein
MKENKYVIKCALYGKTLVSKEIIVQIIDNTSYTFGTYDWVLNLELKFWIPSDLNFTLNRLKQLIKGFYISEPYRSRLRKDFQE